MAPETEGRGGPVSATAKGPALAWAWALPFLAWVLSFAPRIRGLGLYWDDYLGMQPLPFAAALRRQWVLSPSRPGLDVVAALGDSLVGIHPEAWQAIMAALALMTALLLGLFTRSLCVRLLRSESLPELGGAAAAALWLLFPWGLACTAWPGAGLSLSSMALFCAAGWALAALRPGWTRCLLAAGLFLLSGTCYEPFWFQSLLLTAVLWAWEPDSAGRGRDFAGQALAQAALLFWNRLTVASPGAGVTKVMHPEFLAHLAPLYLAKAGLALAILLALRKTGILSRRGLFPLLLLGLASIVASAFLFAAAGLNLTPGGWPSRSFLAVDCWLAAALGWIFSVLAARRPGPAVAALVLVGAVLAALQASALGHWEASWTTQQRILSLVPSRALETLPPRSVVVADLPPSDEMVDDFSSCGDLAGAVMARDPATKVVPCSDWGTSWATFHSPARSPAAKAAPPTDAGLRMSVLRRWALFSTWDGRTLKQTVRGGPLLWTFRADHVYLWNYPSPTLTELPAGWSDR